MTVRFSRRTWFQWVTSLAVLFYGYIFDHAHTLNLHILTVFTDQHIVTASTAYLCWFLWYFNKYYCIQ